MSSSGHPVVGFELAASLRSYFSDAAFLYPFQSSEDFAARDFGSSRRFNSRAASGALEGVRHLSIDFSRLELLDTSLAPQWSTSSSFRGQAYASLVASCPNLSSVTVVGSEAGNLSPIYPQDPTFLGNNIRRSPTGKDHFDNPGLGKQPEWRGQWRTDTWKCQNELWNSRNVMEE